MEKTVSRRAVNRAVWTAPVVALATAAPAMAASKPPPPPGVPTLHSASCSKNEDGTETLMLHFRPFDAVVTVIAITEGSKTLWTGARSGHKNIKFILDGSVRPFNGVVVTYDYNNTTYISSALCNCS